MAINYNTTGNGEGSVVLSNGHLEALQKIVKDYGLKSEKEAVIFMLGIISQASGKPIEVNNEKFLPSDALKA